MTAAPGEGPARSLPDDRAATGRIALRCAERAGITACAVAVIAAAIVVATRRAPVADV